MSTAAYSDVPTAELPAVTVNPGRDRCAGCGAPLASDQRYCVECGRRLGRARLPFMDDPVRYEATGKAVAPPPKGRGSASTTLLAGIGTLLLAMGIGVLIGRSAPASSKGSGTVQVLSAPGTSVAGATGASAGSEATQGATPAATPAKTSAGGKGAKATVKSTKVSPPAKVVKVGSPGKGPGYEKGRFTGNFFGKGEE